VSVPIKVEKKAVKRNLLRRRGYVIIRENLENIKDGFSVVIILKKGAEKLDFEEYRQEIAKVLEKARVFLQ
jgi:ribonuclease P protein component